MKPADERREPRRARELARRTLSSPEATAALRASFDRRARADAVDALRRMAESAPAAEPRRLHRAWLAAAAIVAVIGAGVSARLALQGGSRSAAEALAEWLRAGEGGAEPGEEATEWLARLLPEEGARRWLTVDPRSPDAWRQLEAELSSGLRRAFGAAPERLLEPRATLFDPRPRFRFEVPDPGGATYTYLVTIECEGSAASVHSIDQGPGVRRVLEFELPPGATLPTDVPCSWKARLDPVRHPELARTFAPEPASFRIEPAARRDEVLALRPTGDADLDGLLRAAIFLGRDAPHEALEQLAHLTARAREELGSRVRFLEGAAHARLLDSAAVEALRPERLAPRGG